MISIFTYGRSTSKNDIKVGLYVVADHKVLPQKTYTFTSSDLYVTPLTSAFYSIDQAISFIIESHQDEYFCVYTSDIEIIFAMKGTLNSELPGIGEEVIERIKLLRNNFIVSFQYASPKYTKYMRTVWEMVMPGTPSKPVLGTGNSVSYFNKLPGEVKLFQPKRKKIN